MEFRREDRAKRARVQVGIRGWVRVRVRGRVGVRYVRWLGSAVRGRGRVRIGVRDKMVLGYGGYGSKNIRS